VHRRQLLAESSGASVGPWGEAEGGPVPLRVRGVLVRLRLSR
jgi:hypothetical protein